MSILTTEQQEIKEATKEFVATYIIPHAAEYDKNGEFHPYLLEAAKESKIFSMGVPKKYGGLEYSALTQAVVLEEWGYGCAGHGYHARGLSSRNLSPSHRRKRGTAETLFRADSEWRNHRFWFDRSRTPARMSRREGPRLSSRVTNMSSMAVNALSPTAVTPVSM